MNLGFRAKFFIFTVLIVVAVDLAAGIYLQWKLRVDQEERIEAELSRHARAARQLLEAEPMPWEPARIDPLADRLGEAIDARVTVIAASGRVLGDSKLGLAEIAEVEDHDNRPEVVEAQTDACGLSRRHSETLDTDMLYCAMIVGEGEGEGYVRVATPLQAVDESVARLRVLLVAAGLLAVALAIGVGLLVSRLMYGRLNAMMEAARAMAEGKAGQRLPVSADEFGGLAGSFNRVSEELARTVKELATERDLLEAVLQSMDEAVLAVDVERRIIAVNRSARELLNISRHARGRLLLEVVRIPQLSEALDTALQGESRSIDVSLETSAGVRHLLVRATPRGEGSGAVLVMHDVSEIRRLETVRRDFVANVSHELRTPVSIIQANTETLLSGAIEQPDQARRFLDAVRRNAERLGQLISDLLDISRIEAGKYKIDARPISLGSAARSVNKAVSEACRRRGVMLEVEVDPELRVRADPGALEQVLVNLVENAIKYGPEGGLVELIAIEQGAVVRIEVRDEGPGIAPDHRRRVFERFYRVDPGRSRGMGGTGLGLAIVKNLTEAMGGDVGVDPREPTGSVFWVRLSKASGEDSRADEDASEGAGVSAGGVSGDVQEVALREIARADLRDAAEL
ncbi:PAS domain-containing protein [Pseudenhygromyxa sp. WMMC2535]|uniref:ATP-binding protein n=1 Tax=Pseudenhygromyxa sp. WMMC2535 TaxID=2712867 RepID=UPI00155579B7|nr:PAS domain-containing protein [Pseudenhygromyxa sp. WMMC2535]